LKGQNGNAEKPLRPLPQETLWLRKPAPQLSKKEPALQYCGGQSRHNLGGCRGHHFEPYRARFIDRFRPRRKGGGKLQKIRQKKTEKANFGRVEYKKYLTRFGFISEANLSTKKPSSTN